MKKDKKLWVNTPNVRATYAKLIPVAANKFNAAVLPSPVSFIKDVSRQRKPAK